MSNLRTKRAVSALAALTLAVGGIGAVEVLSDHAPAAVAASCPAPTTNITSKVTISDPELTDQNGHPEDQFHCRSDRWFQGEVVYQLEGSRRRVLPVQGFDSVR